MVTAYVMINVELGGADVEVLQALNKSNEIKEAYRVFGVYDIIAKVEAETTEKLNDTITNQIRKLDKIRSTQTLLVTQNTQ